MLAPVLGMICINPIAPAQETLAREINPSVYSVDEFDRKLAEEHPFVSNILTNARIPLIGDVRELGNLGK